MTGAKPRAKATRSYQKHGLTTAKRALQEYGSRAIDGRPRTRAGRAPAAWKAALVDDLGGDPSAQQLTVLELAARTKVLLDGIDAWLFDQPSLVNRRDRRLFPVVKERQALADSLARYMGMLGLERKAPTYDLTDYVIEQYGEEGE